LVLRSVARQWRNDSFHIRILLEKSSDFVQETQQSESRAWDLLRDDGVEPVGGRGWRKTPVEEGLGKPWVSQGWEILVPQQRQAKCRLCCGTRWGRVGNREVSVEEGNEWSECWKTEGFQAPYVPQHPCEITDRRWYNNYYAYTWTRKMGRLSFG
jgi:hypothetical protein